MCCVYVKVRPYLLSVSMSGLHDSFLYTFKNYTYYFLIQIVFLMTESNSKSEETFLRHSPSFLTVESGSCSYQLQ